MNTQIIKHGRWAFYLSLAADAWIPIPMLWSRDNRQPIAAGANAVPADVRGLIGGDARANALNESHALERRNRDSPSHREIVEPGFSPFAKLVS